MLKSILCLIIGGKQGGYLRLTIMLGQNNSLSDQRNNPISFAPYLFLSNDLNGAANLSWTIFNGFGVKANKTKLEQLQLQSENTATLAIENTIHGIILPIIKLKCNWNNLVYCKIF